MTSIDPPKHLQRAGKALWKLYMAEFVLDDAHSRTLLTSACEHADARATLQNAVDRDGYIVEGRYGQKLVHPGVDAARKADAAMRNSLNRLGVDLEPIGSVGRPAGG